MSKKRVHELGKQLKEHGIELSNQELVEKLHALGYDVKSHSSSLEDDQAQSAYERILAEKKPKPVAVRPAGPGFVVRKRAHPSGRGRPGVARGRGDARRGPRIRGRARARGCAGADAGRDRGRPSPTRRRSPAAPLAAEAAPGQPRPPPEVRAARGAPRRCAAAPAAPVPAASRALRAPAGGRRARRAPRRRPPRRTAAASGFTPRPRLAPPGSRPARRGAGCHAAPAAAPPAGQPARPGGSIPRTLRPTSTQAVVISPPAGPGPPRHAADHRAAELPGRAGAARARRGPRAQGRPRHRSGASASSSTSRSDKRRGRTPGRPLSEEAGEEPLRQGAAPGGHRRPRLHPDPRQEEEAHEEGGQDADHREGRAQEGHPASRSPSRSRSSPRPWASRRRTSSAS